MSGSPTIVLGTSAVSFGYRIAQPLMYRFASPSTATECPGSLEDPKAAPGYFCAYQEPLGNATASTMTVRDPEEFFDGETGHTGAVFYLLPPATLSYGIWGATAP